MTNTNTVLLVIYCIIVTVCLITCNLIGVGEKIDSCMNRDSMFLRFESIQKF